MIEKHIILKKLIVICLAAALSISCCACDEKNASGKNYALETVADTDYSITFYWGPEYKDFTAEAVAEMKEAGFDTASVYNMPWGGDYAETGKTSYYQILECAELLEEHGLKASVYDGRISTCLGVDYDKERLEGSIKRVARMYKDSTAVTELYLCDEPAAKYFPAIADAVKYIRQHIPGKSIYLNLLPDYATSAIYGTKTYEEYVESFAKTVNPDYLCTDYYAFTQTGRRTSYAYTLETIKNVAEEYGLDTRLIVLCSKHGIYDYLTYEELSWQANLSLLYGTKQLSWYTYSHPVTDPTSSDEMIDINGEKTQHYYDIKDINADVRVLGNALFNTDVDEVYTVGVSVPGLEEYETHGNFGKINSGNNMYISFYEDDSLVFLMSDYSEGSKKSVLKADVISSMEWCNPDTNQWEKIESCPYVSGRKVTLGAGEGVLLRFAE